MSYLQTQIENLLRIAQSKAFTEPYHETLEYIKLDGTQYFNPDLPTNADYTIEARFKLTDTSSSSSVFGGRNSSSNPMNGNQLHYIYTNGKTQYISGYSTSELAVADAITLNDVCEVVCDKTGFSIAKNGGTPTKYSRAFSTLQYTTDLMIGATYTKTGNSIQWGFRGEYYMFKVRLNGELIRDYVPALDSKMRPCLYDKVTKTFLYAKKISGGTETYDLGFKRWNKYDVDYIQSSGTEYINTGFKFTNTSAFEIICAQATDYDESSVLCGVRDNTDTTTNARIVSYRYAAPSVLRGDFLLLQRGGYDVAENVIYIPYDKEFHTYYQSPTRMSIDDTDRPTVPALVSPNMDFYIFWQNVGTATAPNKAKIKVKSQKLWDNGTLVRDFKPSVRTYNDGTNVVTKAFLYDEVYNKAYDNAGTGSFKAYIENTRVPYTLALHDNMDIQLGTGAYINGSGVVASDTASCYTKAIPVKQGDVITLTVTGRATTSVFNKRIHAYTADDGTIAVGSKGSWVSQLGYITFPIGQTNYTTQTLSVTIPSGVNYIRLSHALSTADDIILETQCDLTITRTYEVGKAIKFPANKGFTLDAPNSSNFILDLLTRATTTSSYYILDTRYQAGSNNEEEFGIGGSSSGATVNWKCESESNEVKTGGVSWQRNSNYTYSQLLVGYKEGNTFKRTAVFYDFNKQKISDIEIVTATRDIANNTKPLTILHTTSSNWLQNGADIHYFKYLQDDNDVWYDCIPVRNATLTSSVLLFDRANNTSLPNTGSGTPTFVALD